ncbi:MAG: endonuclease III [Candidatus Paceibacterota bacterium]
MKEQERKNRAHVLLKALQKLFPQAHIMLIHKNPWELLVAVILSAQCTDKKVNEVTQKLFKKYKTIQAYAYGTITELEKDIFQTGFYHTKAKHIKKTAQIILEQYKGKVPNTMEELLTLPGVARKTANIVLGNAFGIVEGIAVDTHVRRFALKFNLTHHKNTNKIEQDLMRLIPKKYWLKASYQMIEYGRQICPARKHICKNHPLSKIYPPAAHTWPKTK